MASSSNRVILVTGATGHQGGAAFRHLQRRFPLRVLAPDPENLEFRALAGPGVELVQGDMEDIASLKRAMDGVYGVYSMQPSNDTDAEVRQGANMVDAAVSQSVGHFVYSSVVGADQHTGVPHFESKWKIEEHIRATGIQHTILRPLFFMENWFHWKDQILNGRLEWPLRLETCLQMLAVDDIGAFVALAFEHPGKWMNRTFEMAGDELSMAQVAQGFGRMLGHDVNYVQLPWSEFEKRIDPAHLKMFHWFEGKEPEGKEPESKEPDREAYHVDISAVRAELPQVHTFERWLQSTWRAQVPAEPVGSAR